MTPLSQPAKAGTDPLVRFLLSAVALVTGWFLLYSFVLHPWGGLDRWLIDQLTDVSGALLQALGHELLPAEFSDANRYLGVQGGSLLWIGDHCSGLTVMAVFAMILLAMPGPPKHKIWFISVGLLIIHFVNVLRVVALCLIVTVNYEWLSFNHDYTFLILVYGTTFALWYLWVRRFWPAPSNTP